MVGHLVVVLLLMMMVPVRGNLVDLVTTDILAVTLVMMIKTMTAVLVTKWKSVTKSHLLTKLVTLPLLTNLQRTQHQMYWWRLNWWQINWWHWQHLNDLGSWLLKISDIRQVLRVGSAAGLLLTFKVFNQYMTHTVLLILFEIQHSTCIGVELNQPSLSNILWRTLTSTCCNDVWFIWRHGTVSEHFLFAGPSAAPSPFHIFLALSSYSWDIGCNWIGIIT